MRYVVQHLLLTPQSVISPHPSQDQQNISVTIVELKKQQREQADLFKSFTKEEDFITSFTLDFHSYTKWLLVLPVVLVQTFYQFPDGDISEFG